MTDDNPISLTFDDAERHRRRQIDQCEDSKNRIPCYRRGPEGMGGVAL